MDVASRHLPNPRFTSSSATDVGIDLLFRMASGAEKDAKNSRKRSFGPCHDEGNSPLSKSLPALLSVENVKSSSTGPFPHGDADAARKDALL